MNRKVILSFLFLFFFIFGCSQKPQEIAKPGEGMITYSVSYTDAEKYGVKSTFFPKEIILIFKDDKAAFIATGGMNMVQVVNLLDHKNKKYVSLLLDNIRENYGCILAPQEISENENIPKYHFELGDEKKMIAGIECRKAIVKDEANKPLFEIYYDEKIKFSYLNSPFKDMNNLFLEYTHTINNLTMKLVATKVDLTTPVDTSLFEVHGDYKWVNQKEFFNHLSSL
jgi:GLPGLI family protein